MAICSAPLPAGKGLGDGFSLPFGLVGKTKPLTRPLSKTIRNPSGRSRHARSSDCFTIVRYAYTTRWASVNFSRVCHSSKKTLSEEHLPKRKTGRGRPMWRPAHIARSACFTEMKYARIYTVGASCASFQIQRITDKQHSAHLFWAVWGICLANSPNSHLISLGANCLTRAYCR